MSRLLISCAATLVAACAGPARNTVVAAAPSTPQKPLAQASAPPAAGASVAKPPPRTRVICEMERPTGSNMPQRVCHSEAAAEAERLRTQDALRSSPRQTIDEVLPSAPRSTAPAPNR